MFIFAFQVGGSEKNIYVLDVKTGYFSFTFDHRAALSPLDRSHILGVNCLQQLLVIVFVL